MTEAARLVNTGTPRSQETRDKIRASHAVSEARQAVYEAQRGRIWTDHQKANAARSQAESDNVAAYHAGRIGKKRGKGSSEHYGIIWDKGRSKWQVRINGKLHGRFDNIEDALLKRNSIMSYEDAR